MEVKDLAGLSQPLTKLVEVVSQGIGVLYEPTRIKKMAKAKAIEIETISSAMHDSKLPIEYKNGEFNIEASSVELLSRTEKRMLFLETKKQKNIEDIISGAYDYLESEEKVSDEPLQEEWINRFFNIAGEICSDDLKIIWSKILSREIKKPGECSIRTLEILRNISREEAELFKKISNYVIKQSEVYYLPNEDKILKDVGITYGEILKVNEASLINAFSSVNINFKFNENNNLFLIYNNRIIKCEKKEKNQIKLNAYPLTEIGRNIFDILSPNFDEDYFNKYVNILKQDLNISYSTIIELQDNGNVEYNVPMIKA